VTEPGAFSDSYDDSSSETWKYARPGQSQAAGFTVTFPQPCIAVLGRGFGCTPPPSNLGVGSGHADEDFSIDNHLQSLVPGTAPQILSCTAQNAANASAAIRIVATYRPSNRQYARRSRACLYWISKGIPCVTALSSNHPWHVGCSRFSTRDGEVGGSHRYPQCAERWTDGEPVPTRP
jgi:hypothetical protein